MIDTLVPYIAEIAVAFVLMLISVLGSWLLLKMKENKSLEGITLATEQLVEAARETVMDLQKAFVDDWKASAKNGKLTDEQIKTLTDKLLDITINKLSDPALRLLEGAKCDVNLMIESAGRAWLEELKQLP